jgi:phenylacetate-coenzyme A ligase PaaK-like adenylate-forming protein
MKESAKMNEQEAGKARRDIQLRQERLLHNFLTKQVGPYSTHYRELFSTLHIDPSAIRTLDDLQEIPFSSKKDLVDAFDRPEGLRRFLILPEEKDLTRRVDVIVSAILHGRSYAKQEASDEYRPVFMTSTTGRSSRPIPVFYTKYDIARLEESGRHLVNVIGADEDDRILNMFPFAPHLAFWQAHYAATAAGVFSISTGGGKTVGTEGNIRLLTSTKPTVLIGMPTFIYHMLKQAVDEGLRCESLRCLVLGGEKVPDGMRKKLASLAASMGSEDVAVVATYGFTEARAAWPECRFPLDGVSSGYHVHPAQGIVEIIDPKTGIVQPEGSPGEIVYTPLDARGTVLLRYRTGDVIDGGLSYEPCPWSGRVGPRLVGQISRSSDVREMHLGKIKGTLVDFNELERALDDMPQLGAWQIELRKVEDDPHEIDELLLHVAKNGPVEEKELIHELENRLKACSEIKPNAVLFHAPDVMRELQGVGTELKEMRVVDHRARPDRPAPPRPTNVEQDGEEKE